MPRWFVFAALGLLIFVIGFMFGSMVQERRNFEPDDIIAMTWLDRQQHGASFPAGLGVMVYTKGSGGHLSVRCRLFDMIGSAHFKEVGQIGDANYPQDAAIKFGKPLMKKDGLHIGGYFLPQAQIEKLLLGP